MQEEEINRQKGKLLKSYSYCHSPTATNLRLLTEKRARLALHDVAHASSCYIVNMVLNG